MKRKEKKRDPRIQKLLDENKPVPFSLIYDSLPESRKRKIDERSEYYHNLYQLRDMRAKRKLTQEELAKRTGLPRAAISKIERGQKNFTFETFIKLINALDIRLNYEDKLEKVIK